MRIRKWARVSLLAGALILLGSSRPTAGTTAPDLTGLWRAKLRFGPDMRGTLRLVRIGGGWRADFAGFSVPARFDGQSVSFQLPDKKGSFRGTRRGAEIDGFWVQPATSVASPLTLRPEGPERWSGEVVPLDDAFTLYLPLKRRADGSYSAFLRNPERNVGRFIPVTRLELEGEAVRLLGSRAGQPEKPLAEGRYDSSNAVISLPLQGATFDFSRDDDSSSAYYTRGKSRQTYRYSPPLRVDDGWPVATLEDVGMSRAGIEKFVQTIIDAPVDSLSSSQIHSVLIARHGKLVLEEYFHGFDRDTPHNLRSATKSWVAVMIGAAMHAGVPIRLNTPVYATMLGHVPADLDPRKRAMTLENLITMTAGYDCDERKQDAPGQEDIMQQQTKEPNWYRYTMNVPLVTAPGDTIIYCSIEANLAGGVLQKIAGEPLPEMFDRLVARPLQMKRYHLYLSPTGDAYGGGGHDFTSREFLKLVQLMVNDGRWGDRQILSRDWARKSSADLRELFPGQRYGYLWNSVEYPYKDRKVRAFFAAGNGGQIFMGIPDLDLVIAFTGGNYADAAALIPGRDYVPKFILPAVN